MDKNRWAIIWQYGAVIGVVVALFIYHQESVRRAAVQALADARRDSIAVVSAQLDSAHIVWEQDKAAWAEDTVRLTTQIADMRVEMTRLGVIADSLSEASLDTLLTPDEVVPILRRTLQVRTRALEICQVGLDSLQAAGLGRCGAIVAQTELLLEQERALRQATETLAEEYRGLANPGWFARLKQNAGIVTIGVLTGIVIGVIVGAQ